MAVHTTASARKRKGRTCATMKREQVTTKRMRKMEDESASFEKLVGGATRAMRASCEVEKSSMLFWRSRILRKKSLDISAAGRIVLGGAKGGPCKEYVELLIVCEGGGWRARNAGTSMKRRIEASGRTEMR